MTIGLICGSGIEEFIEGGERRTMRTPYGDVYLIHGEIGGVKVTLIPRHGLKHEKPPHRVNYRGNVYALRANMIEKAIGISAVGSLNLFFRPGDLIVIDQFIDFTKGRATTFYESEAVHVDATEPYCPTIRRILHTSGKRLALRICDHGTYICTEGPRFETKAEIRLFDLLGADVVGMTNIPEVVLAREMGLCYATLCVVTNWAAGIQERVSMEEVCELMDQKKEDVKALLGEALPRIDEAERCPGCLEMDAKAERWVKELKAHQETSPLHNNQETIRGKQ